LGPWSMKNAAKRDNSEELYNSVNLDFLNAYCIFKIKNLKDVFIWVSNINTDRKLLLNRIIKLRELHPLNNLTKLIKFDKGP